MQPVWIARKVRSMRWDEGKIARYSKVGMVGPFGPRLIADGITNTLGYLASAWQFLVKAVTTITITIERPLYKI